MHSLVAICCSDRPRRGPAKCCHGREGTILLDRGVTKNLYIPYVAGSFQSFEISAIMNPISWMRNMRSRGSPKVIELVSVRAGLSTPVHQHPALPHPSPAVSLSLATESYSLGGVKPGSSAAQLHSVQSDTSGEQGHTCHFLFRLCDAQAKRSLQTPAWGPCCTLS